MKTQTKTTELNRYPSYTLLPWEEDEVIKYANRSHDKFKSIPDTRSEKERILDARLGIGGELAFKNLLTEEKQSLIIDHASNRDEYGSAYDFKVKGSDKEYTIDIKTSIKSDKVLRPEDCNFLWGGSKKAKMNIALCDIYVQMFYDPDEFVYYFIGAISLNKIQSINGGIHFPGKGYSLIRQNEMDYTEAFLSYINSTYRYGKIL